MPSAPPVDPPQKRSVVSRDAWLAARRALLAREKEYTRLRDRLAEERRALPWVRIDKEYRFQGTTGPCGLADLFEGRSQLILHHFMFHPDWDEGCKSCSLMADHAEGALIHLRHHDVAYARVSLAPLEKLLAYNQRMGWSAPWVSSLESDFNYDFGVSFQPEQVASGEGLYNYTHPPDYHELPGMSVFARDEAGAIFHTYSTYARGNEEAIGAFAYFDMTPKGRNETSPMDWARRNDEYGE